MQTTEIRETWTALYARLSLDDGNVGESMSIQSQKAILTRKAEELGIYNYRFYVDDGYSGTNFNRPSFQQMIADIEAGKVTCVITKDLSRLGRNYLESGAYIEVFFPKHQVRYIAVNDGVDSANSGEMDITPFKNILNEFYSRRATLRNSGRNMRKKFCSTRLLRMPLMRWASRSCLRSKSCRQSTNVCQIGFHVQDLIAILFCVICFALFLFQQQISF